MKKPGVQAGLLLRNTILKPGQLALAERGAFKRSRQTQVLKRPTQDQVPRSL